MSEYQSQDQCHQRPTVHDGFLLLAKNTDLPFSQYISITQAQAEFESRLQKYFSEFSTVLQGAFSRKTMIAPLQGAMVDMIVLFKDRHTRDRLPSLVFRELREALLEIFFDAKPVRNRNAIIVPMADFSFLVQPGYSVGEHVYMLPATMFNEWIKYDCGSYNAYFVEQNVRQKGELTAIIRMIKTWNRVSENFFDGYYLELLVTALMSRYENRAFSESICYIFRQALNEVVFQKQDPANQEFNVEGLYDIDNLIKAMLLLKKSHQVAEEAVCFEQAGDMEKAINCWRQLFPGVFPTSVDMMVGKLRGQGIKGADALRILLEQKN